MVTLDDFETRSGAVVLSVPSGGSEDLPPSRVTDLAVSGVQDTFVNLTWTAPGADLDEGTGEPSGIALILYNYSLYK